MKAKRVEVNPPMKALVLRGDTVTPFTITALEYLTVRSEPDIVAAELKYSIGVESVFEDTPENRERLTRVEQIIHQTRELRNEQNKLVKDSAPKNTRDWLRTLLGREK